MNKFTLLVEVPQGLGNLVYDDLHIENTLGHASDVVVGDDLVEATIGTRKDDAVWLIGVNTIVEALDSCCERPIRRAVVTPNHSDDETFV